jgi:hypothetical protein
MPRGLLKPGSKKDKSVDGRVTMKFCSKGNFWSECFTIVQSCFTKH